MSLPPILEEYELGDDCPFEISFYDGATRETPDLWYLRVQPPTGDAYTVPSSDPSIEEISGTRFLWTLSTDYEQPEQASDRVAWAVTIVSGEGDTKKTRSFRFMVLPALVPAETP